MRTRIREVLLNGPATVREIAEELNAPYDTVSRCLRRWPNAVRGKLGQDNAAGAPGKSHVWSLLDPSEVPHSYARHWPRRDRSSLQGKNCAVCGAGETLLRHRIDGDVENDEADNMEILCKSCHGRLHWARRMHARMDEILGLCRFLVRPG